MARLKMLVFEALGMPEHQELFFRHEFRWRGTDRQAEVSFGNIREISDDQLEMRGEEWKVVIDYPFDRDGHNLNEDLEKLDTFRATYPAQRTICWLPSFLNHEAQKAIGTLVRLEHILSENRFKTFVAHLSEQDQAAAKPLLQNQRDQLHNQLRNQIEALYGLRPAMPQYTDTANQLEPADHFQALCELKLKPPVAANLHDALNGLLHHALEFQNPGHPSFEDETRFTKANATKVLEVVEQALATTEPSVVVTDPPVHKLTRLMANPLWLGEMHETRFQLGHHWRGHFAQRQAREAGQSVTVAKLRVWIDEPLRMGLPRLAQDLVIRAWAEQTNHSFAIGTGAVPSPALGELQDAMVLRPVALPTKDEWKEAEERVKALFGCADTSPLVDANNVSVLCAKVRARIEEWLPGSQLLEAELDKTAREFGLAPRSFSRVQTTSEAVVLLKALKDTGPEEAQAVGVNNLGQTPGFEGLAQVLEVVPSRVRLDEAAREVEAGMVIDGEQEGLLGGGRSAGGCGRGSGGSGAAAPWTAAACSRCAEAAACYGRAERAGAPPRHGQRAAHPHSGSRLPQSTAPPSLHVFQPDAFSVNHAHVLFRTVSRSASPSSGSAPGSAR